MEEIVKRYGHRIKHVSVLKALITAYKIKRIYATSDTHETWKAKAKGAPPPPAHVRTHAHTGAMREVFLAWGLVHFYTPAHLDLT